MAMLVITISGTTGRPTGAMAPLAQSRPWLFSPPAVLKWCHDGGSEPGQARAQKKIPWALFKTTLG